MIDQLLVRLIQKFSLPITLMELQNTLKQLQAMCYFLSRIAPTKYALEFKHKSTIQIHSTQLEDSFWQLLTDNDYDLSKVTSAFEIPKDDYLTLMCIMASRPNLIRPTDWLAICAYVDFNCKNETDLEMLCIHDAEIAALYRLAYTEIKDALPEFNKEI